MAVKLEYMLSKFGSVTVMDAEFYEFVSDDGKWDSYNTLYDDAGDKAKDPVVVLDTLKISNLTQEGPRKTATGGQNADVLIKHGKTMRIEMQDALGSYDALTKLFGITDISTGGNDNTLAVTDLFGGLKTIVGKTFVIDQETGIKQRINIVIPKFSPDSIFNLNGDAEGDVSVFDINGDILAYDMSEPVSKIGEEEQVKYVSGGDKLYYLITTDAGLAELKTKPEDEG